MSEHQSSLPSSILETCLYVEDLAKARTFYETFFGYAVMAADDRFWPDRRNCLVYRSKTRLERVSQRLRYP
jgi:predicted enzyme related to lactoylglutathione lyase